MIAELWHQNIIVCISPKGITSKIILKYLCNFNLAKQKKILKVLPGHDCMEYLLENYASFDM